MALRARGLRRDFRSFRAVDGVDLEVAPGSLHALADLNGDAYPTASDHTVRSHRVMPPHTGVAVFLHATGDPWGE